MKTIRSMTPSYHIPFLLYFIVLAFVFGRALLPGAGEMIWGDDIHRVYYFYRQFFNNFLAQGIWPWWNPYTFAGTPFMANPIVNIWYLPTWLFVVLPLNLAYSWHIALHLLWAMMGMFVLLHRLSSSDLIRGSSLKQILDPRLRGDDTLSIGPWIGGLVFGLSGFFTARIWAGHVDVIAAASWMPWVVWAFAAISNFQPARPAGGFPISKLDEQIRKRQERRAIVVAAVVLAMQFFAGYQTIAMFTLEAVAVFFGISLIGQRLTLKMILTKAAKIVLSIVLAIGLFGAVLIPQQEFFRATIRTYSLPYFWNAYGSLTIKSLGQFFNPFLFGDQMTYAGPPPNFIEQAFFVGRLGIVLVIVFLFSRLPRLLRSPRSPMIIGFGFIALFGLWVSLGPNAPIDLQHILWKFIPMYKFLRIPPRHLILVVFGLSGVVGIALSKITSKLFLYAIVSILSVEMILYARHFITLKPLPETRHDSKLIQILKQDKEPYRVLTNFGVWVPPRDSFDFDSSMNYGVYNATGYDTMILRPYYEFIDKANGQTTPSILQHDVQIPYLNVFSKATDILNIKYILHPRAFDPLLGTRDPRFRLIREDLVRDYRLYENTAVIPRFYFENTKEGKANVAKYTPNEIVVSTQSSAGGTLMSSEVFYPGWEGFVDGQKVEVTKSNSAFRALFVPAGRHTVTYRYSPRIFAIGGAMTLLTIVATVFWLRKK